MSAVDTFATALDAAAREHFPEGTEYEIINRRGQKVYFLAGGHGYWVEGALIEKMVMTPDQLAGYVVRKVAAKAGL